MLGFNKICSSLVHRRFISGLTICAYFVASIGHPIASPGGSNHPCGRQVCCCGSEAKCRASGCGCSHSPLPDATQSSAEETSPSCCTTQSHDKRFGNESEQQPSCCKPSTSSKKPDRSGSPAKSAAKSLRWVIGVSAQKCRGGATEWISGHAALPGPLPTVWLPAWPFCHTLPVLHLRSFHCGHCPADPPPRLETV
jgi:hypothetical protein